MIERPSQELIAYWNGVLDSFGLSMNAGYERAVCYGHVYLSDCIPFDYCLRWATPGQGEGSTFGLTTDRVKLSNKKRMEKAWKDPVHKSRLQAMRKLGVEAQKILRKHTVDWIVDSKEHGKKMTDWWAKRTETQRLEHAARLRAFYAARRSEKGVTVNIRPVKSSCITKKEAFLTRDEARAAAAARYLRDGDYAITMHPYACEDCPHWHLTAQAPGVSARGNNQFVSSVYRA